MLFDGPEQSISNGFVSIEAAERARQTSAISVFRAKHPEAYERLLKATVYVKLSHQELEAAKAAANALPTGVPLGDLLDSIERDARAQLQERAESATLAQLEQIGNAAATTAPKAKKAS